MKNLSGYRPSANKVIPVIALFFTAAAITLSGAVFCVYSYLANTTIQVMSIQMPGFILGLLVVYFGARSIVMCYRLRREVYDPTSHFSWSNFKFGQRKAAKQ